MSSKETGGPAFPELGNVGHNSDWQLDNGMTLRDYFAAKALPDLIAGYSRNQGSGPYLDASPDEIAHWAYRYADAMLAARSK
ncbi:hypothetical protein [Erwinia billingiae]|uniref:hypothetical protein n=1 Tax=Erwinia billingiae TaxID=182337 RepID=UPI00320A58FB